MTKKETLDLGGGRSLEVVVGTPEECEAASYVVCGTVSFFSDDVHTTCAFCQAPIVHRPYAPKTPPKICPRCMVTVVAKKES